MSIAPDVIATAPNVSLISSDECIIDGVRYLMLVRQDSLLIFAAGILVLGMAIGAVTMWRYYQVKRNNGAEPE
ncbi:MAG TPA: hypothetical protein PK380_07745 [Deltaproteobacteria bacterium]|nr:hypothetical protein [Deltaproteobacteria bacterium]